jgi:predicted CopG family antitoxin
MKQLEELHKSQLKTIAITQDNYDKLSKLGFTNESFNDVISRLIDIAIESQQKEISEEEN